MNEQKGTRPHFAPARFDGRLAALFFHSVFFVPLDFIGLLEEPAAADFRPRVDLAPIPHWPRRESVDKRRGVPLHAEPGGVDWRPFDPNTRGK